MIYVDYYTRLDLIKKLKEIFSDTSLYVVSTLPKFESFNIHKTYIWLQFLRKERDFLDREFLESNIIVYIASQTRLTALNCQQQIFENLDKQNIGIYNYFVEMQSGKEEFSEEYNGKIFKVIALPLSVTAGERDDIGYTFINSSYSLVEV